MIDPRRCMLLLLAVLTLSSAARAQETRDLAALVAGMGLKSEAVASTADTWRVPFESNTGAGTFDVYVTYANDQKEYALIFTTVVDGPKGQSYDRAFLTEALKLNNDYTGVKFAYDEEYGDLDCQAEVYLGADTVTPAELELFVTSVARVADSTRVRMNGLK